MTGLVIVIYHRYPSSVRCSSLRALGVSALVNKRAHSELPQIVDHLLEPRIAQHGDAFDVMT
jgi:hypothetical protein